MKKKKLIRNNTALGVICASLEQENDCLRDDNTKLMKDNVAITNENVSLKRRIERDTKVNKALNGILRETRDALVNLCEERTIKKILIIEKAKKTVVTFADGTKTYAKCHGDDEFNPMTGVMICIMKKTYGGNKVLHTLEDMVLNGTGLVEIVKEKPEEKAEIPAEPKKPVRKSRKSTEKVEESNDVTKV